MMEEDGGFESAAATTTAGNDNYNGNGSTSSSSGSGGSFLSDHGAGPPPFVFTSSSSKRPEPNSTTTSPSPPKKSGSRRSVQKRVVSVPITDADGSRSKGTGDGAPPSDSWTWRKYGQKPIKGSPYPRGYYRCSSSKGCPARKQVERSRTDPTMLVVTYASEHNHPWPLPKNHTSRHQSSQSSAAVDAPCPSQKPTSTEEEMEEEVVVVVVAPPAPSVTATTNSATTTSSPEETSFSADLAEEPSLMLTDDFGWLSWTSEAFLDGGSVAMLPAAFDDLGQDLGARGGVGDEEDALFAELDELPECSMVLRRGAAADSSLWYTSTTTSWCGSTG